MTPDIIFSFAFIAAALFIASSSAFQRYFNKPPESLFVALLVILLTLAAIINFFTIFPELFDALYQP